MGAGDDEVELKTLSKMVQVIKDGLENDGAIAISDRRHFIYYQPGKSIDLPIHPGDQLREGSVSFRAVQAKQSVAAVVDPRVFGVPYYAIGHPVMDDDRIVGCITAIFPMSKRVMAETDHPAPPYLIGKTNDRYIPISFDEIHWIYADQRKTYIHTDRGDFQNKYTLTQLENLLPLGRFLRCHRSYIVNLESIAEIHPYFHSTFQLVLKDKDSSRIPVSQTYASRFRECLGF